jgi:hypothetical protein
MPVGGSLWPWGTAIRYVPQWDQAVVKKDEADLATLTADRVALAHLLPLNGIQTEGCKPCQVTWQITKYNFDLLMLHPSHYTSVDRLMGTKRSLIVHTDGAFAQADRTTGAPARPAVSEFFGQGSHYNTAAPFNRHMLSSAFPDTRNGRPPGVAMTPTTPIFAAVVTAFQTVRNQLLPAQGPYRGSWPVQLWTGGAGRPPFQDYSRYGLEGDC